VLEQTAKEGIRPASASRTGAPTSPLPSDCQAWSRSGRSGSEKVDALVQVAAYELAFGGLHDADLENWRRCFETNVLGTMTLLRAVHPAMKRAGGGSIVLIGSQSMFLPSLPQAGYAASKGALLTAMYYLAQELGADNVRVNMVVPSWMWGPPVEGFPLRAREEREAHARGRRARDHRQVRAAPDDRGRRGRRGGDLLLLRPREGDHGSAPAREHGRADALSGGDAMSATG
jgi:NAD(P)-dependent dehydrogenase (short-subunit alcohol dehydrogenase family)